MKKVKFVVSVFLMVFVWQSYAQQINPELLTNPWSAFWIGGPLTAGAGQRFGGPPPPPPEFAVYHFRKTVDIATKPTSFVVHVSADNRYKLYVNGVQVSHGPAASSPKILEL